jgi:hypothetical protein
MRDFRRDIGEDGWSIDPNHSVYQTELKEVASARKKTTKK